MRYVIPVFLSLLVATPAMAETRYKSWSDPDKPTAPSDTRMQLFIGELNKLLDEATKARAADPLFLQDLRDLVQKYDATPAKPVLRRIISETFEDGNFSRNPVWTVTHGEYRFEKGWGLRSVAVTTQQSGSQQQSGSDDPAAALLGAILQGALGGVSGQSGSQTQKPAAPSAASVIHTRAELSNAFDMTLELSSWKSAGKFSVGPFQGRQQQAGYRLVYAPGQRLDLVRLGSRGNFVINRSARPVTLEDKQVHSLHWSRDHLGRMQISLDKQILIDFTDQSFRDPFQGLVISNDGTDVIVKSVIVDSPAS